MQSAANDARTRKICYHRNAGFGERYAEAFEDAGFEDMDDLKTAMPTEDELKEMLPTAKRPQLVRIYTALCELTGAPVGGGGGRGGGGGGGGASPASKWALKGKYACFISHFKVTCPRVVPASSIVNTTAASPRRRRRRRLFLARSYPPIDLLTSRISVLVLRQMEAATEARLCQMELEKALEAPCFLDSDNLKDLTNLLTHVQESDVLLLLVSSLDTG